MKSVRRDALATRNGVVDFDDGIAKQYWARRQETFAAEREARIRDQQLQFQARQQQHREYLQSQEWQTRRTLRLQMDEWQCQARLEGCRGRANEVHHLSYQFWGNEPLFDLISVCRPCHLQISEMEGRITNSGRAAD